MGEQGKEKIFVPMSIDQTSTTRVGYFFSPMKSVVIAGGIVPGIFFSFYIYSASGMLVGLITAILIYAVFYSYLIRFIVFEELRLKKMMLNLDKNKKSGVGYFWGLNEIDDGGFLNYKYSGGIKKGWVVRVERGSLVGVGNNFEDKFMENHLSFVRGILKRGYSYDKYTLKESREMPEGIKDYVNRLKGIEDDAQKEVARLNIEAMSEFLKENKNVVVDYYVIYNSSLKGMSTMRGAVESLVTESFGGNSFYKGTRILEGDEVVSFFAEILNIRVVNRDGYYGEGEGYDFSDFGEVYRLFDSKGNEVFLELEDEEESLDVIRVRGGGKTLDDLTEEVDARYSEEDFVEEDLFDEENSLSDSFEISDDISTDLDLFDIEEDFEEEIEETKEVEEVEEVEEIIEEIEYEYEYVYVDEDGNEIDVSEISEEEENKEEIDLFKV